MDVTARLAAGHYVASKGSLIGLSDGNRGDLEKVVNSDCLIVIKPKQLPMRLGAEFKSHRCLGRRVTLESPVFIYKGWDTWHNKKLNII